jgi:FkbM family methyltransferase
MTKSLLTRLGESSWFRDSQSIQTEGTVERYLEWWRSHSINATDRRRIAMTLEGGDCDDLPKVEGAGEVFELNGQMVQRMHEGTLIHADCYCGPWNTTLINRGRGHHEPQEEKVFASILESLKQPALMLELGAWWSFYSLWMKGRHPAVVNLMLEPDPANMAVGAANFQLNQQQGWFTQAAVGERSEDGISFVCESDRVERILPVRSVDSIARHLSLEIPFDVVLVDVQGAELETLRGMRECIENKMVKFVLISTHHHSISGDFETHSKCLRFVQEHGGHIVAEHSVEESYSGDGLVVAQFNASHPLTIPVSFNRPHRSLFGGSDHQLAELSKAQRHQWDTIAGQLMQLKKEMADTSADLELARVMEHRSHSLEVRQAAHSRMLHQLHELSYKILNSPKTSGAVGRPPQKGKPPAAKATKELAQAKGKNEKHRSRLKRWLRWIRPQGAINRHLFKSLECVIKSCFSQEKELQRLNRRNDELAQELEQLRHLLAAGLSAVDAEWYLQKYPDIKRAGANPFDHFHQHGWKEGRSPNEDFDAKYYIDRHPDIQRSGMNPLHHYYLKGREEGRSIKPPDSNQLIDENEEAAAQLETLILERLRS